MGRTCSQCDYHLNGSEFSSNQWRKGDGCSRCSTCVDNGWGVVTYLCQVCDRRFNAANELNMHSQVHRPRSVACPVCHEARFRSGANAVQHLESGYCTGCRGEDNARKQIYQYASKQPSMHRYMTNVPLLTNGSYDEDVPAFPYHCSECSKSFREMSQLLQHQDNKHSNQRLRLTYR